MRKVGHTAAFTLLLLIACTGQKEQPFTLEGTIGSAPNDTLYIVGADQRFEQIDTVVCDADGNFFTELNLDTVTPLTLLLPDGRFLSFYGERGGHTEIVRNVEPPHNYTISGGEINEQVNRFRLLADSLHKERLVYAAIDSFFTSNPYSEACFVLLRDYLLHTDRPDYDRIRSSIQLLSGSLQDSPFIQEVLQKIKDKRSGYINTLFPTFELYDIGGDTINSKMTQDDILLISYWASWDSASVRAQRELKSLQEKYQKKDVTFINISLDLLAADCIRAVGRDTLDGYQICQEKGWESFSINKFNISSLPANLLLNRQKRVAAANKFGKDLEDEINRQTPEDRKKKSKDTKASKNVIGKRSIIGKGKAVTVADRKTAPRKLQ